jgi:hypothetical protein
MEMQAWLDLFPRTLSGVALAYSVVALASQSATVLLHLAALLLLLVKRFKL